MPSGVEIFAVFASLSVAVSSCIENGSEQDIHSSLADFSSLDSCLIRVGCPLFRGVLDVLTIWVAISFEEINVFF